MNPITLARQYQWCTIGHTDHRLFPKRKVLTADDEHALVDFAHEKLLKYEVESLMVSLTLGWAEAALYAAVQMYIPVCVVVPHTSDREKDWSKDERTLYDFALMRAKDVVVFGDSASKTNVVNMERWMLDNTERAMFVADGKDGRAVNLMRNEALARQAERIDLGQQDPAEKRVVNLWKSWATLTGIE